MKDDKEQSQLPSKRRVNNHRTARQRSKTHSGAADEARRRQSPVKRQNNKQDKGAACSSKKVLRPKGGRRKTTKLPEKGWPYREGTTTYVNRKREQERRKDTRDSKGEQPEGIHRRCVGKAFVPSKCGKPQRTHDPEKGDHIAKAGNQSHRKGE